MILLVSLIVALSVGLLFWLLVNVATRGVHKYKQQFTGRVQFQAREFFLFLDPRQLFLMNIGVMALSVVVVWLLTGSWVLCLVALVLLGLAPRLIYKVMRQRRLDKFEQQLPDALMILAGGMRAGVGLSSALQQLVAESRPPIQQEFSLLLREQRLGVTAEQSLSNLARRVPTQTTVLVVSAMRVATETGGGLSETLERTAHLIRSRLQMEGKIKALTAQGKMQAWVVGLLPVLLMVVLDHMEPEAMSQLWHTPMGWGVLAILVFLEVMGLYIIRKIVTIDV
ncbi:pilus assembly protein [Aquabacterium lacunae]|uniref:Pilus assembly protein n=2 Tax=Aquabacterium lacunae TaxID=2528630 RepID=A0A4Q9H1H5_9BURK|nr:pilus assembly protein [Aquabacterium lacunae]